jgi:hypothetical protein
LTERRDFSILVAHNKGVPVMQVEDARYLMQKEMCKWGLIPGWRAEISNRMTSVLGKCNYTRKAIVLSAKYILENDEAAVLDTIRHEIAHALAGSLAEHGPKWKEKCVLVGCTPKQFRDRASINITYKWQLAYVVDDEILERFPSFAHSRRSLAKARVKFRPETFDKLEWVPA